MEEAHGYRDALHWRIRVGNGLAAVFGVLTVLLVLLVVSGDLAEFGVMGAGVTLASLLGSVRLVTASRIALYHLGPPGPRLMRRR
ncbi:MAG: hypothetical protein ACI8PZ_000002 [Myxococcota bacterium]|jgi:hypothetical protein